MAVELAAGTILGGDFRVVRPLGDGGMGSVYVVEQLSTGAERALKLMHRRFAGDKTMLRRFETEARVGARIESEHVVHVLAAGIDPSSGSPWIVMELLEGEDLIRYARRVGPLTPREVHAIFEQLCHAMGAAHDAGVVHRDLKPENVFLAKVAKVGAPYEVKVLDFGIAKVTAELSENAEAGNTETIGTPAWMAPEQMELGATIVPATDVWALGLIAFRLLSGKPYWRSLSPPRGTGDTLLREIALDVISPASVRARELGCEGTLPDGFDRWFERCVAREQGARFADARAAWVVLAPILRGDVTEPPTARPRNSVPPRTSAPPPAGAPSRTQPLPLITQKKKQKSSTGVIAGLVLGSLIGVLGIARFVVPRLAAPPTPAVDAAVPAPVERAAAVEAGPPPVLADLADDRPTVHIPGGTFAMGSNTGEDDERPVHTVTVQPFDLDQTEVSVAAYRECVAQRRCAEPAPGDGCNYGVEGRDNHPINCVDWNQASAYCRAHGKRLATEEEWELAARGTKGTALYPWGATPPGKQRLCWNGDGNSEGKGKRASTCEVGTPDGDRSPYGVLGLAGNVSEWTASRYCPYPIATCSSPERIVRGATWVDFAAVSFRSTYREHSAPTSHSPTMGFRCARTP